MRVGEHARPAVPRHQLEAVRAEIGNQKVAVLVEREPVGQRAFEIPGGLGAGAFELAGRALRHDLLRAVGRQSHHAAPGVG